MNVTRYLYYSLPNDRAIATPSQSPGHPRSLCEGDLRLNGPLQTLPRSTLPSRDSTLSPPFAHQASTRLEHVQCRSSSHSIFLCRHPGLDTCRTQLAPTPCPKVLAPRPQCRTTRMSLYYHPQSQTSSLTHDRLCGRPTGQRSRPAPAPGYRE